jgi:heat-inducible transcriptional repressor
MSDLSPRKEQILRAVIVEYISTADPVASDVITSKYELGVKSATVRNELAEITDLGLLEQPHTSAGRIPSDRGYRYFVNHLLTARPLTPETKGQIRTAADEEDTLRDMLAETTKLLSRMTHQFTAAATVKDANVAVRHAVITALGPDRAMLVLVLGNGHVENRIIPLPAGTTLEQVGETNEVIARAIAEKNLGQIGKIKLPAGSHPRVDQLLSEAAQLLRAISKDLTKGHLITEGEEYILAQPEFRRDVAALESLFRSLEDEDAIRNAVVGDRTATDGITIGRENNSEQLHPLTLARRVFYVGNTEAGTIAIIGPTRMDYERGVSLLDFTAKAVSQTLTRLFG